MPRPQKNTEPVKLNLSTLLLAEIRTKHPALLKPANQLEWRHGALSSFVENILWKELRGTSTNVQSQIVSRRLTGIQSRSDGVGGGDSGQGVHGGGTTAGRDEPAGGELGDAPDSDTGVEEERDFAGHYFDRNEE